MRTRKQRGRRMTASATQWALKLWESLDTAVSLSMTILYRHGEFEQLVKKTIDPRVYLNASAFHLDYQAVKALSKFPYLDTKIDREAVAKRKFLEAEVSCCGTNERFIGWSHGVEDFTPSHRVRRVLYYAQRKIAAILGDVPSYDAVDFKFGPGASFGVRGDTSVYKKLASPLECTFAFAQIAADFLAEFPGWYSEESLPEVANRQLSLVAGSELTFVPKDAKTDRPICIEPMLCGLYQKGAGSYIRNRLSHHGVNLRDQTINQSLAGKALDDGLATVDFSSASDTIAYMLILELLPTDWFEFLDVARSPSYLAEGNWYNFHKFTSMGNAYTFELETLVFYALAVASCIEEGVPYETGANLHVYGDDVIIPKAAFDLFLEVSTYCGFTINTEKSFTSGVFYESCGADWFSGHNVRPILLKKRIQTLQDLYYVSNSTLAIAAKVEALRDCGADRFIDRRLNALRALHAWVVGCIPRRQRLVVPMSWGYESGLHGDFDLAVPVRHESWDAWWFRAATVCHAKQSASDSLAYALYHAGDGSEVWWDAPREILHSEGYTLRRSKGRIVVRKHLQHGSWDCLPVKWSERAVSLLGGRNEC